MRRQVHVECTDQENINYFTCDIRKNQIRIRLCILTCFFNIVNHLSCKRLILIVDFDEINPPPFIALYLHYQLILLILIFTDSSLRQNEELAAIDTVSLLITLFTTIVIIVIIHNQGKTARPARVNANSKPTLLVLALCVKRKIKTEIN